MLVKINRRQKYEINFAYSSDCPEWKWSIQRIVDLTWNKFINWNPLLNDVIKLDDSDSWSADYTMSKVFVPLLKQLKETNHGYGYIADKDVPKELRTGSNEPDKAKYEWFIDEVIWCLSEIAYDEPNAPDIDVDAEDYPFLCSREERTPEQNKASALWLKEQKQYEKRIRNGCRLMGTYYRSLWD